jgi:transcriptional regulator with XRE-family HTH domain
MDSKELGKKIKEARIAKKMTQSQVVGNFITRNMLSQIESGIATPSIKTLGYLSHVLQIPFSQLMPDQQDDALAVLETAKVFLKAGGFEKVMEMEAEIPEPLKDEFFAIFSLACLNLSKKCLSSECFLDAIHFAQKAVEYADQGIYSNAANKSEGIVILTRAAEKIRDSLYIQSL